MAPGLFRLSALLLLGAVLSGCATALDTAPINVAASPSVAMEEAEGDRLDFGETAVALSFSGGGTRAAAFAHGVLEALHHQEVPDARGGSLAERVPFVSAVSGGSVAAAYFAYRGPDGFDDFRERFLLQNVEASLRTSITPANVIRALEGGVNDRSGLPRWLNANLFQGATYGDIRRPGAPTLWLNASDIYNRNPFIFDYWTFSVICSDLDSYQLSEAVAASAAVPIAFTPILLRNYSDRCPYQQPEWVEAVIDNREAPATLRAYADALDGYRDTARQPRISLVDGGVTDNLGVYGLTVARGTAEHAYEPMEPDDAVNLRNMLFVVVDAGRGPESDWPTRPGGPTGTQVAQATVDTMIESNVRYTYDAFSDAMERWRQDLIAWRCGLSASEVRRLRGSMAGWNCRDLEFQIVRVAFDAAKDPALRKRLNQVETRFTLPEEEVDMLIRAGRAFLESDPGYQAFLEKLH